MSAYQYTPIPGALILNDIASLVGSGENYLEEQHLALRRSRQRGLENQKRFSLQLDDSRAFGHGMLLAAPNAITSLGQYGFQAPRSNAERERVLIQQAQLMQDELPVVEADQLAQPAIHDEQERQAEEPALSGPSNDNTKIELSVTATEYKITDPD
jgi:hypothetical protein